MRGRFAGAALVVLVALGAACKPELGAPDSFVSHARVIAVKAEPAEAAPGEDVTYSAVVASPDGTSSDAKIAWALCAAPKALGENGVVSSACLKDDGVRQLAAVGVSARSPVPADACALFGPEPPPGDFRPRDPDVTGGYFQPVRASLGGDMSFALERLRCRLANAPADAAAELARRYTPNLNPRLAPLRAAMGGADAALEHIPRGARLVLTASWSDADAETYVMFDEGAQAIVTRREAMTVSWYASAGRYDADRTGRGEGDPETTAESAWTAPDAPGSVHVWSVLRDSRGGTDWQEARLTVE